MEYRQIRNYEIDGLIQLDRKENIESVYYLDEGKLKLKQEIKTMEWTRETYKEVIYELKELFFRGGCILGAFDGDFLVGIVALDNKFMGKHSNQLQLTLLQVNEKSRGKGIGRNLVEMIKSEALKLGAEKIYISASNSRKTVDFYLSLGCELASEVDKRLYEMKEEDIHLELKLRKINNNI